MTSINQNKTNIQTKNQDYSLELSNIDFEQSNILPDINQNKEVSFINQSKHNLLEINSIPQKQQQQKQTTTQNNNEHLQKQNKSKTLIKLQNDNQIHKKQHKSISFIQTENYTEFQKQAKINLKNRNKNLPSEGISEDLNIQFCDSPQWGQQLYQALNNFGTQNQQNQYDNTNQSSFTTRRVFIQDNNSDCTRNSTESKKKEQVQEESVDNNINQDFLKVTKNRQLMMLSNQSTPYSTKRHQSIKKPFVRSSKEKMKVNELGYSKLRVPVFVQKIQLLLTVKRFIQIIQTVTNQDIKHLKENDLQLINDLSYASASESQQNYVGYQFQKLWNIYRNSYVILPENKFIMVWNIMIFILIIGQVLFIPLKVSFDIPYGIINKDINLKSQSFWLVFFFGYMSIFFFSLDVLFSFNKAFYQQGLINKDKQKIAKKYINGIFIFDIITITSLILAIILDNKIYDAGFLCQAYTIPARLGNLDKYYQLKSKFGYLYELIVVIFMVLIMAHIAGCGFYQLGNLESYYVNNSWIKYNNLEDEETLVKYVTAIYFTFISMITVGYGDIYPVTTKERIYVIIMAIISGGVFGYSVNKISNIFQELQQKKNQMQNQQEILMKFFRKRQISYSVQNTVLKYVEYQQNSNLSNDLEGYKLLNLIQDDNILKQFKINYFGRFLKGSKVFQQHFTQQCIEQLALQMEELVIDKQDILFSKGDIADNLYFFIEGKLGAYQFYESHLQHTQQKLKLGLFPKNQFIGLKYFLLEQQYNYSVKPLQQTRIAKISRKNFLQIINKFPIDKEKVKQLKDNTIEKNDNLSDNNICKLCKTKAHSQKDCENMFVKLNKQVVINKYQYSPETLQRTRRYRHQHKQYNAFKHSQQIRYELKDLRISILENYYDFEINNEDEEYIYDETVMKNPKNDKYFFIIIPMIKNNKISKKRQIKEQQLDIYDSQSISEESSQCQSEQNSLISNISDILDSESDYQESFLPSKKQFTDSKINIEQSIPVQDDKIESLYSNKIRSNSKNMFKQSRALTPLHINVQESNAQSHTNQSSCLSPQKQIFTQIMNQQQQQQQQQHQQIQQGQNQLNASSQSNIFKLKNKIQKQNSIKIQKSNIQVDFSPRKRRQSKRNSILLQEQHKILEQYQQKHEIRPTIKSQLEQIDEINMDSQIKSRASNFSHSKREIDKSQDKNSLKYNLKEQIKQNKQQQLQQQQQINNLQQEQIIRSQFHKKQYNTMLSQQKQQDSQKQIEQIQNSTISFQNNNKNQQINLIYTQKNDLIQCLWLGRQQFQFDIMHNFQYYKIRNNYKKVLHDYEQYQTNHIDNQLLQKHKHGTNIIKRNQKKKKDQTAIKLNQNEEILNI